MEILAGLVQLDKPDLLPTPWFNRPSLGLVTNTDVRIGVLKATSRQDAPPDIIVTPLKTDRLHFTASVMIDLEERTGAVHEALRNVKDVFNIALAETVTIDQRTRHRITLVFEPPSRSPPKYTPAAIREYKKAISAFEAKIRKIRGFINVTSNFMVDETTQFERQETSVVRRGSINYSHIRSWISRTYIDRFDSRYDFSRVVVSSSADGRFIRYIFPRRGVFEVTISHLDVPTALAQLSGIFRELNFNILLSRLSRSVGTDSAPGKSILVAICEPIDPPSNPGRSGAGYDLTEIRKKIRDKLDACISDYQFNLNQISLGARIDRVAYPYRHGIDPSVREVVAQAELDSYLDQYKRERRKAVFVSYMKSVLQGDNNGEALRKAVFDGIERAGCRVYNGYDLPHRLKDDEGVDVRARMWMASAGVFFAYNKDGAGKLSENQLIEWGYIYGQGKPWVVIVRSDQVKNVELFMIPRRSFVTYDNLDTPQAIEDVGNRVTEAILNWFPKITDAAEVD